MVVLTAGTEAEILAKGWRAERKQRRPPTGRMEVSRFVFRAACGAVAFGPSSFGHERNRLGDELLSVPAEPLRPDREIPPFRWEPVLIRPQNTQSSQSNGSKINNE